MPKALDMACEVQCLGLFNGKEKHGLAVCLHLARILIFYCRTIQRGWIFYIDYCDKKDRIGQNKLSSSGFIYLFKYTRGV